MGYLLYQLLQVFHLLHQKLKSEVMASNSSWVSKQHTFWQTTLETKCEKCTYHIISYHIISYHIISYHIISYHIISYQYIMCTLDDECSSKQCEKTAAEGFSELTPSSRNNPKEYPCHVPDVKFLLTRVYYDSLIRELVSIEAGGDYPSPKSHSSTYLFAPKT